MVAYKDINGIAVEMSAEEEAELNTRKTEWENNKFNRAIKYFRQKRNSLLAQTDYLALSDNTMSENMTTYRQQLRDATSGLETVEDIELYEFPTKPN